jgi:ABC-type multidrug transport system fused ATPase/permease subunit
VYLTQSIDNLAQFSATALVLIVIICIISPPVIAVVVVAAGLYYLQVIAVDRMVRSVKWLANQSMSPLLGALSENVHGRILIRSMHFTSHSRARFLARLDQFNRFWYAAGATINWGMFGAYIISFLISMTAGFCLIGFRTGDGGDSALVALALTYSINLPYFLQFLSFVTNITNMHFLSLERLLEMKSDLIPAEPAWALPRYFLLNLLLLC